MGELTLLVEYHVNDMYRKRLSEVQSVQMCGGTCLAISDFRGFILGAASLRQRQDNFRSCLQAVQGPRCPAII